MKIYNANTGGIESERDGKFTRKKIMKKAIKNQIKSFICFTRAIDALKYWILLSSF